MGIDNIRPLKQRQRPRCADWNAIVEQTKVNRPKMEGKKPELMRRMTQFYTAVEIPPYSIFPLIPNATDNNHTFNATYTVEKYRENRKSYYMPGYIGANGRMGIPAGSIFLGFLVDTEWDTPVKVHDYESGTVRCGFKDNSWEAWIESTGLILNGSAPQGDGIYYCRIENSFTDPLLCASEMPNTDTRPQGAFELSSSDTWLYADSLDSFGTENDDSPPKVANPCGYPEDRPVIVGRVQGFPGGESEEESTGSNGSSGNGDGENSESGGSSSGSSSSSGSEDEAEVDLVAIACDTREFFMINNGSGIGAGENPPSGNPGIYKKGSLHYIKYDSSSGRWIPANEEEDEESTGSNSGSTGTGGTEEETSGNGSYNYRLAVCQRDMPAGWNVEFRMPYYAPEMNYGAEPQSEGDFQERCGVLPGEHKFSKKRLDYHYVNKRYSYEPRFVFIGDAEGYGSGVGLEIEGETYQVEFPDPRSTTSYPDVYEGDQITVEVDASGDEPKLTAIDFPMDFPKGTIIASYVDLTASPYRGWQDVTDTKYGTDIGNADLLILKTKNGGKRIADLRTHQCTCSNSGGSGSSSGSSDSGGGGSGGGHTCPHEEVTTAEATFRWYLKIKGSALI